MLAPESISASYDAKSCQSTATHTPNTCG
jgi:hypothetical protein